MAFLVDTDMEPPVVVETIRFPDDGALVPLSWKLSKEQKQRYLNAWDSVYTANPELRNTLDRFFTRAETGDHDAARVE
jgi:hypothetical protein